MTDEPLPCPGCGLRAHSDTGATHDYIGASAGCWAAYGELLAREYQDPSYFRVHGLTVDTYCVQHPGQPERRSIQSVAVHLITLAAQIDGCTDQAELVEIRRRFTSSDIELEWLEPVRPIGMTTVADVLQATTAEEHEELAWQWARDVYAAWSQHHGRVEQWRQLSRR